ncbi:MAG UNVERIFIED_CONTAM: hypothetical protein LVR29_13475 [Microcystis novacekii LVE1205-3]
MIRVFAQKKAVRRHGIFWFFTASVIASFFIFRVCLKLPPGIATISSSPSVA